ncbi:phosphatidylinositol 3 and 4-kinase-domain-containing protein [Geopyxis carbonaria]|nr:phosphatidylinositol 3 and 4-kinase-domain-containing protein [Geopyxis carbonaria]
MPRIPAASGYQRLAQETELSDSEDDESSSLVAHHPARIVSVQPNPSSSMQTSSSRHGPGMKRTRSNTSAVDIKVINARLEKWADQIASKFKFKKGQSSHEHPRLEILYSVFVPPENFRSSTDANGSTEPPGVAEDAQFTHEQFEEVVDSVRQAIAKGIDPKLIRQGSSGSYFMRDSDGKIVGVFKPKDEEPYGKLNPKMMKWLHRTLFPCFFGRACLIPNLSYISEAAACLLDRQLKTYMVPYTDVVHLSSKAFHYDYWDRRAFYRRRKPLPPKVGSFQVFLQGYQDANIFLRNNPWPDPYNGSFRTDAAPKRRSPWSYSCRPSGDNADDESEDESESATPPGDRTRKFAWTEKLKQNFREELEKLVILDYIMRNTDRGLDNWMIRVDYDTQEVSVTSKPLNLNLEAPSTTPASRPSSTDPTSSASAAYQRQEPMVASSRSATPMSNRNDTIKIGAIDNSLAFPWKHPDQWRSFPFGWLFLPVSLIGQPFSKKTRDHFIPLLTSTKWWSETQTLLRGLFEQDSDFKERMYQKQLAVLKGQAWNVVETLKAADQGPLELTRRARVHVWDDEMEVPVAVPLRMPSTESRRRREADLEMGLDQEEMDIGAIVSSAPIPEHDLLGFSPPRSQIPSSVRLGVSKSQSSGRGARKASDRRGVADVETDGNYPSDLESLNGNGNGVSSGPQSIKSEPRAANRPGHRSHKSYDAGVVSNGGGRRQSWDFRRANSGSRRGSHNIGGFTYTDDDDGDLGYSALDGSDGAKRKVIAERLETVKTRNPVFTWC